MCRVLQLCLMSFIIALSSQDPPCKLRPKYYSYIGHDICYPPNEKCYEKVLDDVYWKTEPSTTKPSDCHCEYRMGKWWPFPEGLNIYCRNEDLLTDDVKWTFSNITQSLELIRPVGDNFMVIFQQRNLRNLKKIMIDMEKTRNLTIKWIDFAFVGVGVEQIEFRNTTFTKIAKNSFATPWRQNLTSLVFKNCVLSTLWPDIWYDVKSMQPKREVKFIDTEVPCQCEFNYQHHVWNYNVHAPGHCDGSACAVIYGILSGPYRPSVII